MRSVYSEQDGRGLKIPVRMRHAGVADIRAQSEHVAVHAVPVGCDCGFKRPDAEAVPEIMEPRAGLARTASEPDLAGQLDEHLGQAARFQGPAVGKNEEMVVYRAYMSPDSEVSLKGIAGALMKSDKPVFAELRRADDQPIRGDIGQPQSGCLRAPQTRRRH